MSAVHGVFDVVIWYLVATAAYDYAVSGFVIGGLVRALSILARLVGIGIGYLIMLLPEVAGYAVVGVCIGAVYLLVILLWFLWHNAKRSVPGEEAEGRMAIGEATGDGNANPHSSVSDPSSVLAAPTAVKATDKAAADPASTSPVAESISTSATAEIDGAEAINSEEVVFALLADDYGLTRREAEVLPYLARGRSAKVIAEALFVSESTIRTHTRRILEKTCLHSKQELIDLVEKY